MEQLTLVSKKCTYLVSVQEDTYYFASLSDTGKLEILNIEPSRFGEFNISAAENLKIRKDKAVGLKIGLKGTDIEPKEYYNSQNQRRFVCIAEIQNEKAVTIEYILVNRLCELSKANEKNFELAVEMELVDNYYITSDGIIKRKPNQNVEIFRKETILDTYHGMKLSELEDTLIKSGFKLGYESPYYFSKGPYLDGIHREYKGKQFGWYNPNYGAIAWYNVNYGNNEKTIEPIPVYSGGRILLQVEFVGDFVKALCEARVSFSTDDTVRIVDIDIRNSAITHLNQIIRVSKTGTIWDISKENCDYSYADRIYRQDYFDELSRLILSRCDIPEENRMSSIVMYKPICILSMYKTLREITGPIRSILSYWESISLKRLLDEVAKDMVEYHVKADVVKEMFDISGIPFVDEYKKYVRERIEDIQVSKSNRQNKTTRTGTIKSTSTMKGLFWLFRRKNG